MATPSVDAPWYKANPDLVSEIEADLREHYPTLRLDLTAGQAEVRGTYPVKDEDGRVLDRWAVSIILPPRYPVALPIVRETGGRIPADLVNHVLDTDGTACILFPETRYRSFPCDAPFRVYLDGPMRAFFTSQSYRARGGTWVHGEWEHGALAAISFYKELLGSGEDVVGWRALIAMGLGLTGEDSCPCGRRRSVGVCHPDLLAVRDNLGEDIALGRLVTALEQEFDVAGVNPAQAFLQAIRSDVKGHHRCPCGSGARIRDCHPGLRKLRGAWPYPPKRRSRERRLS